MTESPARKKPPVAWLIDCGLPGHTTQVEAIGKILAEHPGAELHRIPAELRVHGNALGFLRALAGAIPRPFTRLLAKIMYRKLEFPASPPDLVISSFSHTISLCRLISRTYPCFSIYSGSLSRKRARWFDLAIVPCPAGLPGELVPPVMPTGRSPEEAAAATTALWPENPPHDCWTMVIGGSSRSARYAAEDWEALAGRMNRAAEHHGIRWLVSTSRRTGAENEEILKRNLRPTAIADAVWWSSGPRKVLAAFIAAGQRVFVTADSATMISEVIAIRGRATALYARSHSFDDADGKYLRRLETDGLAVLQPIDGDDDTEVSNDPAVDFQAEEAEFVRRLRQMVTNFLANR